MPTIHEEIDTLLAADLHEQLSAQERATLHHHLVECGDCRKIHQETKHIDALLAEDLANQKPDPAFETRMLAAFRRRVPQRASFTDLLFAALRSRPGRFAAAIALILALIQVGRVATGLQNGSTNRLAFSSGAKGDKDVGWVIATGSNIPTEKENGPNTVDTYRKDDKTFTTPTTGELFAGAAQSFDNKDMRLSSLEPNKPASLAETKNKEHPNEAGLQFGQFSKPSFAFRNVEPSGAQTSGYSNIGEMTESSGNYAGRVNSDLFHIPAGPTSFAMGGERRRASPADSVTPPAPPAPAASPIQSQLKLIRNAQVELEIANFEDAAQRIATFTTQESGYVATSGSEKQANGKLRGQMVVKVLPQNLERFLQNVRTLGELKNQIMGSDDVTKAYFDTDARIKNSRVMEQRLVDMVKTHTGKVTDLLQVEKELARVREDIEKMQGQLKFWDAQVQFATIQLTLTEKDLDIPAAFLVKERGQVSLYSRDVEKTYDDIKALASPKVQITKAQLDRNNTGRISAHVEMLISPEESDSVITKVRAMGRVDNYQMQTQREARGGSGMSETAKTEHDKVVLTISISREEEEQAAQQTGLSLRTDQVDANAKKLRELIAQQDGNVRESTFSRTPDGQQTANVSLRLPMKNYAAFMQALESIGKPENISIQRREQEETQIDQDKAPVDVRIYLYSRKNIVAPESGPLAVLRTTLGQGAGALTWSLRMIGVALAFLAPWIAVIVAAVWGWRKFKRRRA